MKLEELLHIPVFNGTQIVAGNAGLEREVLTVNMMDAPDIITFLKPNELLITTAFHFKDDLPSLLLLIEEMGRQNCSGLGIKTKRFLGTLPSVLIERANELAVPLLELPVEPSLGDIVNKSLSHILDVRTHELHNAMQAHRQFTHDIMKGEGMVKVLLDLSDLLKTPVFLLDPHLRLLAGKPQRQTLTAKLDQLMSERCLVLSPPSTFSSFSFLKEERNVLTLFPVYTYQQLHYLGVEAELSPKDRSTILTIEQAANVIAFDLMKEQALNQNRRRIQNEFFGKFINGSFSSADEIISRARELGLPESQRYICAVGQLDGGDKSLSFIQYKSDQDRIADHIVSELRTFPQTIRLFLLDKHYVLLMLLTDEWREVETSFLQRLSRLQDRLQTHNQASLSFGVSSYAQQLIHIPVSYKEASEALYFGGMAGRCRFVELYQPKEVPEILRLIPYAHLKKFYLETFQAFIDETIKDHRLLLQTLSVYLETHCQLAETAKRLYIHRNTVIYRLEKCEELLGRSLKDPEETLRLRLAFRIKALLPEHELRE
ncbi:PucR family transcriptional regulator [Bacillus sp. FJAT-27264]|uniref:PucR family transcriptional regulator n=1 Tax=Paenibacillus sp. (strain DSM 101736 / FJAT-27264) TaxID=1850362 RepID=UPI000807FF01|nr:PucR family transcriptional regulator [Bacillus sp. FJAT-27264]OBZ19476.1 PucR family transcriptional regulator [Bacillus sp. FJAT-27264]